MAIKFVNTKQVTSTLIKEGKTVKVKDIKVTKIVEAYRKSFNIDVFKDIDIETIELYKCVTSNYQFYYPLHLSGDSSFYEKLQLFNWYYMPWKWEHDYALKYIKKSDKVLELGCGNGGFLLELLNRGYSSVCGIDLNDKAIKYLKGKGIDCSNLTIQDFSERNPRLFDIVCSFQVLEHIAEVHSFIRYKINCLRSGGKIIISVPNNNSFIKWGDDPLNMPPHHMGKWDKKSLLQIAKVFNLSVVSIKKEPLQSYHVSWFYNIISDKFFHPLASKLLNKFKIDFLIKGLIFLLKHKITGHSLIVVFKK